MEPVTHMLTGAVLSRSGLNRRAAYATLAMVVGAEFPDIDTLWSLRGPVESFTHHRGITHTFIGLPFEAALITGAIYALHRWRIHRAAKQQPQQQTQQQTPPPSTAAPLRWGWLYALTMLALLSHLWLDYGTNYGLRPFFPFDRHWYAASTVFIFDPLLFAVLLLALVLPALVRLINSEVGARTKPFPGRSFARAALIFMVVFYAARTYEHAEAVQLGMAQSLALPATSATAPDGTPATPQILTANRVLMNPDPLSLFRWYGVTDFGPLYQLSVVQLNPTATRRDRIDPTDALEPKANTADPTLRAALKSPLGRAYLDWSPMPFIDVSRPDATDPTRSTVVILSDPRFMGNTPLLHRSGRTPLTGTVELDPQLHILSESVDGRMEPDARLPDLQ